MLAAGASRVFTLSSVSVFLANISDWPHLTRKINRPTSRALVGTPFSPLNCKFRSECVRRRVAPRGKRSERARLTSRCASSGCQLRCSGTTLPTGGGSRGLRHGGVQPQFSTPAYGGHKSSAEVGPNAAVGSNAEAGSNEEVGSNTPGKARCQGSNTIWNVQCQPATRPRLANRQG